MEIGHDLPPSTDTISTEVPWRKWCDVTILVLGNFINYADRYTLAGVLVDVQREFNLNNEMGGLIQTVYVTIYTLSAPLYGYLGDRYDRKLLLSFSVILWNAGNFGCSFVTKFWAFLLLKGVFGLGQACYVTVAPTIIGDLFVGAARSKVLVIFYFAIPMGSGIGYTIGAEMTRAFNDWRWSLRATPCLAIFVFIIMVLFLRDPNRGQIEGKHHMPQGHWWEDIKYLFRVISYIYCTLAFTAVAFSVGAIGWWAPKMLSLGLTLDNRTDITSHDVGSTYGIIITISGFVALCLGYLATFKFQQCCPQIDPVVCGLGCLICVPLLIGCTYMAQINTVGCFCLLFFGLVGINLNWALICDIILRVVVPSKRSMAVGLQLLIGHSLGDAGSPYLLGLMADEVFRTHQEKIDDEHGNEFLGLQAAFFTACAAAFVAALFFFLNAMYIVKDTVKADRGSLSGSRV